MSNQEWRDAVRANVTERIESGFDWSRVTEAVWSAGYCAGLPAEQMGLVIVVAMAAAECLQPQPGGPLVHAPSSGKIVAAAAKMTGSAHVGKPG